MFSTNSLVTTGVRDFSEIFPEGVIRSSRSLASQNVHVMQCLHNRSELVVPPLTDTLVALSLSATTKLTVRVSDQEFSEPLQRGDAVIIPAGAASEWRCSGGDADYDMLHIYLHAGLLAKASADTDFDVSQADIALEFRVRDPHIFHIGLSLLQELDHSRLGSKAYVDLLAAQLAMHLLRRRSLNDDSARSYRGGIPRYKLRRVMDYISDNLDAELKIPEIAQQVHMSPSHFTRQFKLATGLAPHQYIMQKRIEAAKKMLSETEIPIAQIALEIGFQSQSRFTTLFRQLTGTTPRAYRARNAFFCFSHSGLEGARSPAAAAEQYLRVA
jgi:AraC family transcriptional regulator